MFLDVSNDRYFLLESDAETAVRALIAGQPIDSTQAAALSSALRSGVILPTDAIDAVAPLRLPVSPKISLLDQPCAPGANIRSTIAAAAALWSATRALRRRGLSHSLDDVLRGREGRAPARDPTAGLADAIAGFDRLDHLVSPLDQCLPRSIALATLVGRRGISATLIIGVKLRPFLAHSWVQTEHLLVNERHDVVRTFTPILAV